MQEDAAATVDIALKSAMQKREQKANGSKAEAIRPDGTDGELNNHVKSNGWGGGHDQN